MSSISETRLKPVVHWVEHPNFWILRNPEDVTYIEVEDDFNKSIIDDIDKLNLPLPLPVIVPAIAEKYELTRAEVTSVIQHLAQTGMLVGTKPPQPPKRKWTPLDLLYMRFSLINPDTWLSNNVKYLEWIWTRTTGYILLSLLVFVAILAIDRYADIIKTGKLILAQGNGVIIPFILLTCFVVSLHELAHAFTLKHYKGIVPDMGIFLMLLIPACYTNTSDSYPLRRHQQVLVIAAGIICQVVMAALGLFVWNVSDPSSEIHAIAYLLMVTGLVTLAINLNPLSGGFDGYHLAVAITGINNLRSRSRLFYLQLLKRQPLDEEDKHVRSILAIYAPLSLAYILFVFTFLIWAISSWTWLNIPVIAFTLFIFWVIYFFVPTPNFKFFMNKNGSAEAQVTQPDPHSNSNKIVEKSNSLPTEKRKIPILWISLALLGGAMFLPLPHQVGGKVELETIQDLRSFVFTGQATPCTVRKFFVSVGQQVKEGDNLAELSCRTLDENIYKTRDELSRAKLSLAEINNKAIIAKADLERRKAESKAAYDEAARASNLSGGVVESQIRKLQEEKYALQASLDFALADFKRFQDLEKTGIATKRDLQKAETAYRQVEANIAVKDAEIQYAQRQLADIAQSKLSNAEVQATAAEGSQSVYESSLSMAELKEQIVNLETRLKDLESQKQELILKAKTSGTVHPIDDNDLDTLEGKEILANTQVMQIFRTDKLIAKVKVDLRDSELVKKGATVQFRPDQAKDRIYEGSIEYRDESITKSEDISQSRSATFRISINNTDLKLKPNATGYAKIYSKDMFLFQRIQLEFARLIDTKFW